jgi:hypothetical protein
MKRIKVSCIAFTEDPYKFVPCNCRFYFSLQPIDDQRCVSTNLFTVREVKETILSSIKAIHEKNKWRNLQVALFEPPRFACIGPVHRRTRCVSLLRVVQNILETFLFSSSTRSKNTASLGLWPQFLATDLAVPISMPGSTRFSER